MKPIQYHILVAMAGGPIHGAEIRRQVEEQSGGTVTLYPAMLYGSLDDLTEKGWIEEVPTEEGKNQPRWRFYRLTSAGFKAVEEETARLEALTARAKANLGTATGR